MKDYIKGLVEKYSIKGALVDTNLLLLLIVGLTNEESITRFKRTNKYTIDDYRMLQVLLKSFKTLWTTPNILTEVSNLAGNIEDWGKDQLFQILSKFILSHDEKYQPSKSVAGTYEFVRFGLTDSILLQVVTEGLLLITDDFPLAQYATKARIDVINFNHLRGMLLV